MEMVSGSTPASEEGSMRLSMARSYGTSDGAVEGRFRIFVHILVLIMGLMTAETVLAQGSAIAMAKPVKMVVLGDSLSAGYGLPAAAAFPVRLQKALVAKGIKVDMINAGVSGDTAVACATSPSARAMSAAIGNHRERSARHA